MQAVSSANVQVGWTPLVRQFVARPCLAAWAAADLGMSAPGTSAAAHPLPSAPRPQAAARPVTGRRAQRQAAAVAPRAASLRSEFAAGADSAMLKQQIARTVACRAARTGAVAVAAEEQQREIKKVLIANR